MMYSNNVNQQILIALLKAHNIRKIVASPGGTNPALVISFQSDAFFEMYSSIDERSAAYMACGLSEEANEPVVLCCTGATASRNYMPALTEGYYRKLPIIAVTCSRPNYNLGQLVPQVTNRNVYPADIVVTGLNLQIVKDDDDFRDVEFKINKGILSLNERGGGPIHFNVECFTQKCSTRQLPNIHKIRRFTYGDEFPNLTYQRIGLFIGSHKYINEKLQKCIELFCEKYNAVVFSDHTSGYHGKYSIKYSLIGTQHYFKNKQDVLDLIIDMGEMSGDYLTFESIGAPCIWRLSNDGEIRMRFKHLDCFFDVDDNYFFNSYIKDTVKKQYEEPQIYRDYKVLYDTLYNNIPDLPLSHIYLAKHLSTQIPKSSVMHFAILNALRSWNFFEIDNTIRTNCNVGGFGIDGCTSTAIGASLSNPHKLYFLFTGDLAFFYDLNSLGNRHIAKNLRIMLVNDGKGAEFMHFMSPKYQVNKSLFMSAGGHFGNQSKELVKHFAQDLGFDYYQATNKEDYLRQIDAFVNPSISEKPILFEILITTEGQSDAWKILCDLAELSPLDSAKKRIKSIIKNMLN